MHQEMFDDRPERQARGKTSVRRPVKSLPTSKVVKSGPETGKVPELVATSFLRASEPASARIGTIMAKRPKSVANPSVVLYHGVLRRSRQMHSRYSLCTNCRRKEFR